MAAAAAARSGLTTLSHRLMRQFAAAKDKDGSNLVFSPLCIYSALSLMAVGARGSTLSELVDVLGARCREGLAEDASDMVQLVLAGGGPHPGDLQTAYACGLWHDATRTKLKPAYRDVAGYCSMGVTGAVDFFTRVSPINHIYSRPMNNIHTYIHTYDHACEAGLFVALGPNYYI